MTTWTIHYRDTQFTLDAANVGDYRLLLEIAADVGAVVLAGEIWV